MDLFVLCLASALVSQRDQRGPGKGAHQWDSTKRSSKAWSGAEVIHKYVDLGATTQKLSLFSLGMQSEMHTGPKAPTRRCRPLLNGGHGKTLGGR